MPNAYTMNPARIQRHPEALKRYLNGVDILPVTLEFSPAAACNHECWWCSSGYDKDANGLLKLDVVCRVLEEAVNWGCKAVIWSGGGEPFVNKALPAMLARSRELGLDNGVHTNLSTTNPDAVSALARNALWVRVSAESSERTIYKQIHGRDHFDRMAANLRRLVELRKVYGREENFVIGAQIVVSEENAHSLHKDAEFFRAIGIDYLQIHPVTFNPALLAFWQARGRTGLTPSDGAYSTEWYEGVYQRLLPLEDDFVTIKHDQWQRCITSQEPQPYSRCYATFSPFIEGDGNVYYCPDTKRQPQFALGNINDQTLQEIWNGSARHRLLAPGGCGAGNIDIGECHKVCVKRPMNVFLAQAVADPRGDWDHLGPLWGDTDGPTPHVNFV